MAGFAMNQFNNEMTSMNISTLRIILLSLLYNGKHGKWKSSERRNLSEAAVVT